MNIYAILLTLACQGTQPPIAVPESPVVPTAQPAQSTPPADGQVDAILDRLEAQGRTMSTFAANASVQKFEALTDEIEIRKGRVVVEGPIGSRRTIGIVVDEYIDSTGRGSRDDRRFLFRAGWLEEFDTTRKQLIRRQLAMPGDNLDPLRVGEGPFPIPLGQLKADVLREFVVTIGQLPDAGFFSQLAKLEKPLVTLQLVPRGGTPLARDTAAWLLVVESDSLLPRAVELQAINGNRTRVMLRDAQLNEELTSQQRDLLVPVATEGWKIDVRPMQ